jgi:adenosylhomocysteine nucleosidase
MGMPRVVIIAAMKQEVTPLLHDATFSWKPYPRLTIGLGTWRSDRAALVCGGIGLKAAGEATEQAIREFSPSLVISAGLAGALVPELHVATIVRPECVVNSSTGARHSVLGGHGTLVTATGVAGEHGKRLLARHFEAQSADMEAAAVAAVAQSHGKLFAVIKSISDEYDFDMPDLNAFITAEGRFETRRFGLFVATRPRLWPVVRQLAHNSKLASVELCRELRNVILEDQTTNSTAPARRSRESQATR